MLLLYVRKYIVSSSGIKNPYIKAKNALLKFSFRVYFVHFVSINFTLNEEEK